MDKNYDKALDFGFLPRFPKLRGLSASYYTAQRGMNKAAPYLKQTPQLEFVVMRSCIEKLGNMVIPCEKNCGCRSDRSRYQIVCPTAASRVRCAPGETNGVVCLCHSLQDTFPHILRDAELQTMCFSKTRLPDNFDFKALFEGSESMDDWEKKE